MASTVYWLHLPSQTNIFKDGYIGVTSKFHTRMTQHKHKFKSIWADLICEKIVIASKEYCHFIEQKLRPIKNIGFNKAMGGYRNNTMIGIENPNYGKFGELAPNFQGWWITPMGKFSTSKEAAIANGFEQSAIIRKCKGRFANNKFYQPKNGWAFEPKA